jgi:hypothetical protein
MGSLVSATSSGERAAMAKFLAAFLCERFVSLDLLGNGTKFPDTLSELCSLCRNLNSGYFVCASCGRYSRLIVT